MSSREELNIKSNFQITKTKYWVAQIFRFRWP